MTKEELDLVGATPLWLGEWEIFGLRLRRYPVGGQEWAMFLCDDSGDYRQRVNTLADLVRAVHECGVRQGKKARTQEIRSFFLGTL